MAKSFEQIVERLKTVGAPGVIAAIDPEQASKPDPLAPAPPRKEGTKGPFGDPHLLVEAKRVPELLAVLRDDPELRFEMLVDVTGVDYAKEAANLGVIYALLSLSHRTRLCLRADVPKADPRVPTACAVHPGANWHEREAGEMLGLVFEGHPDPRNILLGDDWVGWPLRKDYEFPVEYHGISCV
ncbi:MAG TPA: NADH-quinone oxidoreductase subunit C [Planctomycetota bacterium]|jgi:NADH-quinone oxidoreductase subunit C|nr:NADH-quinone oxidoreductase subunit C [Planctomycetota bacterium]